jgi:amino acid transporter
MASSARRFPLRRAARYGVGLSAMALAGVVLGSCAGGERGGRRADLWVTITVALVLILANVFDLSAIASLGSAVSLVVFLVVALAGMRLRSETGANVAIVGLAMLATGIVLVLFAIDTARNAPQTFAAMIVLGLLAVVLDLVWKRMRPSEPAPAQPLAPPSAS